MQNSLIIISGNKTMLTQRDKNNLSQELMSRYSFSNIAPPSEVYKIQIPYEDYFIQASETRRIRRIFFNVTFSEEEMIKIQQVKQKLIKQQIPSKFYSDIMILKFCYEVDLCPNETFNRLKNSYRFMSNPIVTTFTQKTQQALERGYIYTYGRDRTLKPLCIVQMQNYPCEKGPEEVFNCVYYLMLTILGTQTVPYHAEKYTLFIDFSAFRYGSLFSYRHFYEVFKQMISYYSGNLERTIIYNASGFQKLWGFIKGFIPQFARKRIHFVNQQNMDELFEYVDPSQMEQKFGGNLPNLKEYWPPKSPQSEGKNLRSTQQFSEYYYSVLNDTNYFIITEGEGQEPFCGKKCECCLF